MKRAYPKVIPVVALADLRKDFGPLLTYRLELLGIQT
jgi:hypothetical protein